MRGAMNHLSHSILLGLLLYFVMVFVLKQPYEMAQDRSMLIAALALAYMILFGHSLPSRVNKNIF
jgi:ABC-type phosphate transport system permease subunit